MIPLNDTEQNRYGGFPIMLVTLIVVNTAIFIMEIIMLYRDPEGFRVFLDLYGSNAWLIVNRQGGGGITAVTSVFLHGGPSHLIGNMLFLWVYGRRVEDVCGPWRFLLFYLLCGVMADLVSTAVHAGQDGISIGASGAIAGVMAAYLLLFPKGRIRTFILLGFVPIFPKIRAYWLIFYFLLLQIPPALEVLMFEADYQVGYWAHLGGFMAGIFIFFCLRPDILHRYINRIPI